MTLRIIGNNFIGGESSDTKPTNYETDTLFYEFDTGTVYEWVGTGWSQRTAGLNIDNTFTQSITIDKDAESTTAESLQEWSVSDDSVSFFRLDNLITTDSSFVPHILSRQGAVSTSEALRLDLEVGNALDTGTTPVFIINTRRVDQTDITTRPILQVTDNGVALLTLKPSTGMFDATINATNNTITDTSTAAGDLLKSNGTKFLRMARGSALQFLRVDSGGTDLEYANPGTLLTGSYLELDSITAPTSPSGNSRRLYVDENTPFHLLLKKPDGSTIDIEGIASSSGEANTISNIGTAGVGVFKQKTGVNFELKTINSGASGTITITNDTTNNEIDIDVNAANLLLSNLGGTLGDSQIATHTTTKISTTNKALLNSAIVYNDQNNNLGDFYLDIGDIATPANPSAGTRRLFVDSGTGALSVRTPGGTTLSLEAGATGEANTASNVGTAGVGVFKQKNVLNLEFKKLNAGSNKITITDDTGNNEVDIDIDQANLTLSSIGGSVTTSQLPAVVVRTDQTNTFGNFDQIFTYNKLAVLNSGATFKTIIGSAAAADRTVAFPNADGNVLLDSAVQTITNKTLDATVGINTLTNVGDASIAAHTTTKITTTNKALLNSNIMYEDEDNNIGQHYVQFTELSDPAAPSADQARLFLRSSNGQLSIRKDSGTIVSLEQGNIASVSNIGDTQIGSLEDGQALIWDTTTSKWINEFPPSGGANLVKNDQANTFGNFAQTFLSSTLKIRNPGDTFSYTLVGSAITGDRNITIPNATGNDVMLLAGVSATISGNKTFDSTRLRVRNPGNTASYITVSSAITADRNITLPVLTGDDVQVFEAHTQTLTNKTLTSPVISTISNTGDLTLPTSTDTLVGRATTDTLTNKTINASNNTLTNVPLSALVTGAKQYPFIWSAFNYNSSTNWSNGRQRPTDGLKYNGSNNATKITLPYKVVVTRFRVGVVSNSKNASTVITLMDDNIAVPNTATTISTSTNGYFDSGAISQTIASGSEVEIKVDTGSSSAGNIDYTVETWGYYDPT